MRSLWTSGLALTLGLLAQGAGAADDARPAVSLGAPVSLGRAMALPQGNSAGVSIADPLLRPTSYENTTDRGGIFRGASPVEVINARPMPMGPVEGQSVSIWAKAPQVAPKSDGYVGPMPQGEIVGPTTVTPAPVISGPVYSGQTVPGQTVPGQVIVGPTGAYGGYADVAGQCCDPCCDPCLPDCCCGDCCCDTCCCDNGCCFGNRWYVTTEYLLWWMKAAPGPVLVTTSNGQGTPPGALGQPGTRVLFGGSDMGTSVFNGGRLNLGYWFTDDHCVGLDFGGFFLGGRSDNFSDFGRGDVFITRPFVDVTNGLPGFQSAEPVSAPGTVAGMINVRQRSNLWGGEANLRSNVWCGCCCTVDLLAGFRALGLDESVSVTEKLVAIDPEDPYVPVGTTFDINDTFKTTNRFYGGQIGAVTQFRKGRWVFDLTTKVALGGTQQLVQISGFTATNGGPPAPGGLLTGAATNIGRHMRSEFSVVPEVGLNIGYQCTEHITCFVGYNFLYWSSVARAGDQIDVRVNRNNVLGSTTSTPPNNPALNFKSTDFWAQGLVFGLAFKF